MQVQKRAAWRWFLWPLIFLLVLGLWGTGALAGQEPVKVVLNDEPLVSEVTPFLEDGRTFVPVRALLEALGAEVKWDGTTGTVEVVKGDTTVGLTVGSRVATVTREGVTQVHHLDVVPKITQGRTFIPARFVATALGAEVSWDPSLRVVKIILQLGPQKEELVIAVDTHYASPKFDGGVATGTNIYEPLLFLDERLELNPGLVTSWERLDPLTWRFHLRKGVKFHNGKEFNADAAVYAFTRILDQPRGWVKGRLSQVVEHNSFRILDDYTLEVKTLKPYPFLPYLMSHPYMVVAEPEAAKRGEIVGTGPFKFKEDVRDQYVVVERNKDYWGEKPKVERIVFKTVPDANTRLMALQKGEVDAILDPPFASVAALRQDNRFQVITAPRVSTVDLLFNRTRPPFDDVRVRKALCLAINKEEIINTVMAGIGKPARTIVPPEVLYSAENELNGFSYNPGEARRLLAEVGFKDVDSDGYLEDKNGQKLELLLPYYAPEPGFKEIAELVQSYYAKIGLKSRIIAWEAATYYDEFGKGNWDVCVDFRRLFWGAPSTLLFDDFYSQSGLPGVWYQGVSSEVDRLIEEGMELEAAGRFIKAAEKYIAVQRIAIDEQAVLCPIAYQQVVIACKKDIKGIHPHPLTAFYNGAVPRTLSRIE